MFRPEHHQLQLDAVLDNIILPPGVSIRSWIQADFPSVQRLAIAEGWSSFQDRPDAVLAAYQNSWPVLVAIRNNTVIGFIRALTDEQLTMYIADILVGAEHRRLGIGRVLLETCHYLCPNTRQDLLSDEDTIPFYEALNCRRKQGFRKSYDIKQVLTNR